MRTNVMGTTTLLDACPYLRYQAAIIRCQRMSVRRSAIRSSGSLLYRDDPSSHIQPLFFLQGKRRPFRAGLPQDLRAACDVSRCSNNYGPYHFPEKLIPLIISRALANEELPVYGTGENVRDWLHVADHCEAIDLVIHKGREGEVYNIGGHNERTNLEVVKTILKALDKPESLIRFVTDRPGHDMRYAIDPTKIETELGWKPKYNFDTGIEQTIQWYLDNQDWWKNILSGEYSSYLIKCTETACK